MKTMIFLCALYALPSIAQAHGEDKPGPHGGFVRMPGAYHTELVQENLRSFRVYLLNMQFKEPTAENSTVGMSKSSGKTIIKAECSAEADSFVCRFPEGTDLAKGEIKIESSRKGMKANSAAYKLPLKLDDKNNHSGH